MRTCHLPAAAATLAFALTGYAHVAAPQPVSFHCRGFSLVAEMFPPKSRNNPSDRPMCYFYSVGYPGAKWKVDAKLLWKAQLVRVPRPHAGPYQAVVSMRGHLVTINGGTGTYQEHSVAIYDPNGKLVRSYPFKSLTPLVDRMPHLPMWGWHRGARYFFPRKAALFYILLPWGKAMEFGLKDGSFRHGDAKGFPELTALAGKGCADEEAMIWRTSLRFSSITDVIQARASAPNRGEGPASIAPEDEVALHALLKQSELIVVGRLRRTDDSLANKMWAGHIDVAKVLLGDPSVRDVHVHFQDPDGRGGAARRDNGQSGIWFIFRDGRYRKVIWPNQLRPAGFERKLGPYLKGFIAAEIRRLGQSNAEGIAKRLQHLRANLKAMPTTRPAAAATKPAVASVRFEPSTKQSVAYVGGEWLVIYLVDDEAAVRLEIPLGAKRVKGRVAVAVAAGKARAALARGRNVWKHFRPGGVVPPPPSPPAYREESATSGSFTCVDVPARKTWPYHGKTKTTIQDVRLTFPSGRVTVAGPLTFVLRPFPT